MHLLQPRKPTHKMGNCSSGQTLEQMEADDEYLHRKILSTAHYLDHTSFELERYRDQVFIDLAHLKYLRTMKLRDIAVLKRTTAYHEAVKAIAISEKAAAAAVKAVGTKKEAIKAAVAAEKKKTEDDARTAYKEAVEDVEVRQDRVEEYKTRYENTCEIVRKELIRETILAHF
jgi:hypothetical protein